MHILLICCLIFEIRNNIMEAVRENFGGILNEIYPDLKVFKGNFDYTK